MVEKGLTVADFKRPQQGEWALNSGLAQSSETFAAPVVTRLTTSLLQIAFCRIAVQSFEA